MERKSISKGSLDGALGLRIMLQGTQLHQSYVQSQKMSNKILYSQQNRHTLLGARLDHFEVFFHERTS